MRKRIAKEPYKLDGFPGSEGGSGINTNQQCLDFLVRSLTNNKSITKALYYYDTKEGSVFWSNYMLGIVPLKDVVDNIKQYIDILAVPIKPFDRKDWL